MWSTPAVWKQYNKNDRIALFSSKFHSNIIFYSIHSNIIFYSLWLTEYIMPKFNFNLFREKKSIFRIRKLEEFPFLEFIKNYTNTLKFTWLYETWFVTAVALQI